ncbi:MAG TPA: LysR substrate-binding domain-containing protein [Myxococcota bacterium]|nr:LysR substrate-binding domain-containing protein [Myxococcota bacterium]
MQPTLRQLEYLVAVADRGSFHAAARACHVSQPGLSAQIQQLEGLLGLRLFERNRRRVLITAEGEQIVQRARELLAGAAHLVEAARVLSAPLTGRLRLGVIPTIAPYLLPQLLPRVRERYPALRVELREGQTAELVALLLRGELDLLLLALEARLAGVESSALFRDEFAVAMPASHPLAARKRLADSDLAGESILLLEDGHCLRDQALAVCDQAGVEEAANFRASSLPTLVQMVAAGSGVTLLPSLAVAVEARAANLAVVAFRDPAPYRTIGLAWRPTSPRADEFRLLGELMIPSHRAD